MTAGKAAINSVSYSAILIIIYRIYYISAKPGSVYYIENNGTQLDTRMYSQGLPDSNSQLDNQQFERLKNDIMKLQTALSNNESSAQNLDQKYDLSTATAETKPTAKSEIPTDNNIIDYLNPLKYLNPQIVSENLQNSFTALTNATQELIPIVLKLSQISQSLPQSLAGDMPSSATRLSSIVTNDLPKITSSLPNSVMQLANAVSKLATNATQIPSITKDSTSETVKSMPSEVMKVVTSIRALQTLVTSTLPEATMIAASAAKTGGNNLTNIPEIISLLTNAAQDLPNTALRAQSAISSFIKLAQNLPEGSQLPNELVEQLKLSLNKFPDIIKAMPANLRSITTVVNNLEETVRRTPNAFRKSVGVLPVVGNKDSSEAIERIKLRERFESSSQNEPLEGVVIGDSLLKSFNGSKSDGTKKLVQNLLISMRNVVGSLQGQNAGTFTAVRPLLDSAKSLLQLMESRPNTNKFIPRAALDPLLGLVSVLTNSLSKT